MRDFKVFADIPTNRLEHWLMQLKDTRLANYKDAEQVALAYKTLVEMQAELNRREEK